jgi:hypothetical protein
MIEPDTPSMPEPELEDEDDGISYDEIIEMIRFEDEDEQGPNRMDPDLTAEELEEQVEGGIK